MPAIRQVQRRGWCPTTITTSVGLCRSDCRRSDSLTYCEQHHITLSHQHRQSINDKRSGVAINGGARLRVVARKCRP